MKWLDDLDIEVVVGCRILREKEKLLVIIYVDNLWENLMVKKIYWRYFVGIVEDNFNFFCNM